MMEPGRILGQLGAIKEIRIKKMMNLIHEIESANDITTFLFQKVLKNFTKKVIIRFFYKVLNINRETYTACNLLPG